jgi:hypothetical protein
MMGSGQKGAAQKGSAQAGASVIGASGVESQKDDTQSENAQIHELLATLTDTQKDALLAALLVSRKCGNNKPGAPRSRGKLGVSATEESLSIQPDLDRMDAFLKSQVGAERYFCI